MKKYLAIFLAVILSVSAVFVLSSSANTSENGIKAAMGNENANAQFNVKVDSGTITDDIPDIGDEIEVVVELTDIVNEKLAYVSFDICYDATELELITGKKSDGSLDFITKVPNRWENLTTYSKIANGVIPVKLLVAEEVDDMFPKADGDITLTLKFKVLKAVNRVVGVYVPHASVKGNDWDDPTTTFAGNGSYTLITVDNGVVVDPTKESITVDGNVSDSGWTESGWVSVSKDNGAFQQNTGIDSGFNYKFQMRTDDTKLYVAAVYDDAEIIEVEGGVGTKIRLWIKSKADATIYTHFYDLYVSNNEITTAAKYNQSLTENKGANIENSSVAGAMTAEGNKVIFELSVDLAEFGGENGFEYFFTGAYKIEGENVQLFYPAVEIPESGPNSHLPYSTWDSDNADVVDVEELKLGDIVVDPDETEEAIKAAMGKKYANAQYNVKVDMPSEYKVGDEIDVVVKLTDIANEKLAYAAFDICYDTAELKLLTGKNEDGSLNFITKAPDKWENLTAFEDSDKGVISASLIVTEDEIFPKADGDITLTLKFKVLDAASGKIGVYVPNTSVNGSDWDNPGTVFAGNGSYALADAKGGEESSSGSSSESSSESSSSSSAESSKPEPKPGDATNMIIFAIIAIVAIAGSAVVIKSRR